MMKYTNWLILSLLFISAFSVAACSNTQPTGAPSVVISSDPIPAPSTTPPAAQPPADTGQAAPAAPAAGTGSPAPKTVEISMTAVAFQFTPNAITVHKGDHVIIHITDSDKGHGIAIEGYDQHVEFGEGNTGATLDFIADKAGTFTFYCNVPCGSGHRTMKGTLTVQA